MVVCIIIEVDLLELVLSHAAGLDLNECLGDLVYLLDHERALKALHGVEGVLQVVEAQLNLLEAVPLQVDVHLGSRVLVEQLPVEPVLLNLISQLNQLGDLTCEVVVVQAVVRVRSLVERGLTPIFHQDIEVMRFRLSLSICIVGCILVDKFLTGGAFILDTLLVIEFKAVLTNYKANHQHFKYLNTISNVHKESA